MCMNRPWNSIFQGNRVLHVIWENLRISQDIFFPDVQLGWKNHFCVYGTVLGAGIIVVP